MELRRNKNHEVDESVGERPTLIGKLFKNPCGRIVIIGLLLLTAAGSSGCLDDAAEPMHDTSIFVYQHGFGQDGDPEDVISNEGLYALVSEATGGDEKSGKLVPAPVVRCSIEEDPETGEITVYGPDDNIIDPADIPEDWEDFIVKDEAGAPVTDASQLDLHIEEVGRNKYEIHNLAQEMDDPDGEHVWKVSHAVGNKYEGDTKFNDNVFKIGDNTDDMFGGFTKGEDGKVYGVILADEDVFKMYGGDFGTTASGENTVTIVKSMCTDTEKGIYIYDLSKMPENSVSAHSDNPISREAHISREKGGVAQFMFEKEKV
ncbi:MAG: hypothetical protein SYNGOMJ08_00408 [Candidatus Syntrophoarchaeum sp. GoM_oil]|nr:MAG: hypothetical protein SYNGOMJ08_00408 [Candidatus Syntrophoarchaeum sp. GoM_oil]